MKHFQGLIPATYTPFKDNGDLDLSVIPAQAQYYAEQKFPAVFVCGSTGESHSTTTDERLQVAETWKKHAPSSLEVIVHVGHNSQRDAVVLAKHAREIGAAAVSAMAPCYFKPGSVDDLVEFIRPIAAACAPLGFYFYDIPGLTGVSFRADHILAKAAATIPNFAGIKYTSADLMRLQTCLAYESGKYNILYGTDEILLATLALGIKGGVGSTYNYAPKPYLKVIEAFNRGDMETARAEQRKSVALVEVLIEHGVLRTGKAIMSLMGLSCGTVRYPNKPVGLDELKEIHRKLSPMDIFARPLTLPRSK